MKIGLGRRTLRSVLVIPLAVLTVLSAGVMGFVSFHNGQQAVEEVTGQLQHSVSAGIEGRLRSFLADARQLVRLNADAISRGLPGADDAGALECSFREQVRIFELVSSVYFGNTRGGLVNSGREPATDERYVIDTAAFGAGLLQKHAIDDKGNRTALPASVPDFDARTRPWYKQAVEKGDTTWTPPYILATGQDMAIACSHPVHDFDGALLGVVSVDFFLSHLANFLQSLKIGEHGQTFIFDRSGLLIASSAA